MAASAFRQSLTPDGVTEPLDIERPRPLPIALSARLGSSGDLSRPDIHAAARAVRRCNDGHDLPLAEFQALNDIPA
jgi:hypothetical protein